MFAPSSFEAVFRASPNPYMVLDRELRYVEANDAYLHVTASRREDLLGRTLFEAFPNDPADPANEPARLLRASLERVLAEGVPDTIALIPYRVPRHSDAGIVIEERFWSATHTPILDERGEVAFILQHTVDVTELQRLKQAVRATEDAPPSSVDQVEAGVLARAQRVQDANVTLDAERRHLLRVFEQAPGFLCFLRGPEHVFELANRAYLQLVGNRDVVGKPIREALPEVAGQGFFELLERVHASGEPFVGRSVAVLLQRREGEPLEERFVDFIYQPVRGADGTTAGILVQGSDVTTQKLAEDELRTYREHLEELVRERTRELERSEAERRKTEAELRHAHRLEAVGKLTGGVAHDFNNLLQVIGGNLQLLEHDLDRDPRVARRLQSAIGAVERGAKLAAQLLAFARRQPLEPTVIHLGRVLEGVDELIRRPLGEGVAIEARVAPDLWNTFADPNQVANVILNLAINARDAMDGVGTLTIVAENVTVHEGGRRGVDPGEYVRLALSDTGSGMPPEVLERAFDPFFTTKPVGQGTGLGLSMVYGFVKQSGGHVAIESEVGRGTTIEILLPRTLAAEATPAPKPASRVVGGGETVLVVEDDPDVRTTAVEMLQSLGYRVLEAPDAQRALATIEGGAQIDVLFSDVVMPGPLQSPELAERAKTILPDLEVLFTSGYAQDAIVHSGRLDPDVRLLSKPYRKDDLARKLHEILRGRKHVRRASLRVLVAEDDADLREALTEMIALLGHEVVGVATADAARSAIARDAFDVLLTDVNMPGASGADLAREALDRFPGMRVIVTTGDARPDVPSGAVLLPKPFDLDRIEQVLGGAS